MNLYIRHIIPRLSQHIVTVQASYTCAKLYAYRGKSTSQTSTPVLEESSYFCLSNCTFLRFLHSTLSVLNGGSCFLSTGGGEEKQKRGEERRGRREERRG